MHALAVYGWDLRNALAKSATSCRALIARPGDNFLDQMIENSTERAALRIYPSWPESSWPVTLFERPPRWARIELAVRTMASRPSWPSSREQCPRCDGQAAACHVLRRPPEGGVRRLDTEALRGRALRGR
jgi:hypothetical protein